MATRNAITVAFAEYILSECSKRAPYLFIYCFAIFFFPLIFSRTADILSVFFFCLFVFLTTLGRTLSVRPGRRQHGDVFRDPLALHTSEMHATNDGRPTADDSVGARFLFPFFLLFWASLGAVDSPETIRRIRLRPENTVYEGNKNARARVSHRAIRHLILRLIHFEHVKGNTTAVTVVPKLRTNGNLSGS